MRIKVIRHTFLKDRTIGTMYINDLRFCETLEDVDRGLHQEMELDAIKKIKVYGETAIPYGTYNLKMAYSPKYKKKMPLLENVPGYSGVLVHIGNIPSNSKGCLLVGMKVTNNNLVSSTIAFNALMEQLNFYKDQDIKITIEKKSDGT